MSLIGNFTGNKAVIAHNKGQYDKAMRLYEEAYAKGMDKPRLLRSYSVLLIRSNQFDRALEIIKKLEHQGGLTPRETCDLHVNYAIILAGKGHLERAMEILEDEFRHTQNGNLYSIIGYYKIEQGDPQAALDFNLKALEYDDTDPVFLDNLGQTYYRLFGEKEKARPYFEKAIALKPGAIDTNYFLALYDIEEGDWQSARARLLKAKEGLSSPLNYATPERIEEALRRIDA